MYQSFSISASSAEGLYAYVFGVARHFALQYGRVSKTTLDCVSRRASCVLRLVPSAVCLSQCALPFDACVAVLAAAYAIACFTNIKHLFLLRVVSSQQKEVLLHRDFRALHGGLLTGLYSVCGWYALFASLFCKILSLPMMRQRAYCSEIKTRPNVASYSRSVAK